MQSRRSGESGKDDTRVAQAGDARVVKPGDARVVKPGDAGVVKAGDARAAMDALRRIVQELRVASRSAEQNVGISGAQLFVLQQLAEKPADSLGELAERTLTHQSSVSIVVGRLVERGYVVRRPSREDARRVGFALTAAGERLLRRAPPTVQSRLVDSLEKMSPKVLRELADGLTALATALAGDASPPPLFFEDAEAGARSRPTKKRPAVGGATALAGRRVAGGTRKRNGRPAS